MGCVWMGPGSWLAPFKACMSTHSLWMKWQSCVLQGVFVSAQVLQELDGTHWPAETAGS